MPASTRPLKSVDAPGFKHHFADVNGIEIHYTTAGRGQPLLLLHGWPFTWYTWSRVIPSLAERYTVIAPDARGIGLSARPASGYDLHTKADDARALLDHLGVARAQVVGHDLGAEVAYMLAMRHPERVQKLVLMEAIIAGLPGAEAFMKHVPWWFGFHEVPGLAETVIVGNEDAYLGWFFDNHSYGRRGISAEARAEYVASYAGTEALRGGFAHYRAFRENAAQVQAQGRARLTVPTLALGGNIVGDALRQQLVRIADDLAGHIIPECGHNIPEERPDALCEHLAAFLD